MVIVKKQNLWKLVDSLKEQVDCKQFLILKTSNEQYQDFFFVIYQSQLSEIKDKKLKFTVIHKKGRSYYTINALNRLIEQLNGGVQDKNYMVDWEQYQNMILFMNKQQELVKIPTKLHRIIHNKEY